MNKCREPTSKHFVHELFKHAFNDVNIAMGIECSKQFVKDMLLVDRNICKYSQQVELLLFNIDRIFHHNPSGIPFCFSTSMILVLKGMMYLYIELDKYDQHPQFLKERVILNNYSIGLTSTFFENNKDYIIDPMVYKACLQLDNVFKKFRSLRHALPPAFPLGEENVTKS